jgi:hypothetical protein
VRPIAPIKGKGDGLVVARTVIAAIGILVVGSAAFLLFGQSLSRRTVQTQPQTLASQKGKLLIVTEEGATCQQLSFDNKTGQIVDLQKGPCRDAGWPRSAADDTPLGSIHKALNAR